MNSIFHFIPADKIEYYKKIKSKTIDYFIFDLEDAVSEKNKKLARELLYLFFKENRKNNFFIRINSFNSSFYKEDIYLINKLENVNIILPKCESEKEIYTLAKEKGVANIVPLIESFKGLKNIDNILSAKIFATGLGIEDMLTEIPGFNENLLELIKEIKKQFSLKCKLFSVLSIDGIPQDLFDKEKIIEECNYSISCGFDAKFSVHPLHVDIIDRTFNQDTQLIKWAEDIIKNSSNLDTGYLRLKNGEIITPPKIKKALKILENKNIWAK